MLERRFPDSALYRHPLAWIAAALGAVLGALGSWWNGGVSSVDGFVAVEVARLLADRDGWAALPELVADDGVSPLGTVVLAVGVTLVGPAAAGGLVASLFLGVCGWLAVGIAEHLALTPLAGWFAVTVIATSPAFVAGVGLEGHLAAALLLGLLLAALRKHVVATGALCGLAMLVRADLAVPAAVLAVAIVVGGARRARPVDLLVVGGTAVAVALPWWVWAWSAGPAAVVAARRDGPDVLTVLRAIGDTHLLVGLAVVAPFVLAVLLSGRLGPLAHRPWAQSALLAAGAAVTHVIVLWLVGAWGSPAAYTTAIALSALTTALVAGNVLDELSALVPTALILLVAVVGALVTGPFDWPRPPASEASAAAATVG